MTRIWQEFAKTMTKIWLNYDRSITNIWQEYDWNIIGIWQIHNKDMTEIWQEYDKYVTRICQNYDRSMTNIWQKYDKNMTGVWQKYDKNMTCIWNMLLSCYDAGPCGSAYCGSCCRHTGMPSCSLGCSQMQQRPETSATSHQHSDKHTQNSTVWLTDQRNNINMTESMIRI
jgi:hypothetical protein